MRPVKFNEVVRVTNDCSRAWHQPIESRTGVDRLQTQRASMALDLDRLTRGEDLIEDRVDILAQLGGSELHKENRIRTYVI